MALPAIETSDSQFENHLRERRQIAGLSQKQLGDMAGITRQAVAAVETGQYSPATSVALQLARVLRCRVEDLFSLKAGGDIVEGEWLGPFPKGVDKVRAQVSRVGSRLLVRPLDGAGEVTSLTASADGLIVDTKPSKNRVRVTLLKDLETVRRQVVIGGCDPAMFLAAEHLRRHAKETLIPCLMSNASAIAALKRGEVHAAGVHLVDEGSRAWNLPPLTRGLSGLNCTIVTFAHWEEGFIVRHDDQRTIRAVADLARPTVKFINRERGSGARLLLDRELRSAGILSTQVNGYGNEVSSHLEVAARVKSGFADAGIGVRAAATIFGLAFVPLQRERYGLVIPKIHYESMHGLRTLLEVMVGRGFRDELEALGGYDTRDTGKIVEVRA